MSLGWYELVDVKASNVSVIDLNFKIKIFMIATARIK